MVVYFLVFFVVLHVVTCWWLLPKTGHFAFVAGSEMPGGIPFGLVRWWKIVSGRFKREPQPAEAVSLLYLGRCTRLG